MFSGHVGSCYVPSIMTYRRFGPFILVPVTSSHEYSNGSDSNLDCAVQNAEIGTVKGRDAMQETTL